MVTCPVCNKDDAIQKVSAIRKMGVSSGVFAGPSGGVAYVGGKWGSVGGYTALAGTTTTRLAEMLPPPDEPKLNTSRLGPVGAVVLLGGIPMCVMAASSGSVQNILAVWVLWVILLMLTLIFEGNKVYAAHKATHDQEKTQWERQMVIYRRLYYCHRDDIAFDPETGQHRPVAQTWQLIQAG